MRRFLALAAATTLLAGACTWRTPPPPESTQPTAETTRILAADGTLITTIHASEDREVVPLSRMPRTLIDAVVDIEDARFWDHRGVDLKALARAIRSNADGHGPVQGASTITQQYVKTLRRDPDRTPKEKVREAIQAVQLERQLTKERILELYLNAIYFGNGAYGVEAAAQAYFGIPVDQLDLAQSALLAGLANAPGVDDPYVRPQTAVARRNLVLQTMAAVGSIGREVAVTASALPLHLRARAGVDRYPAAYFVEQVKQFVLDDPHFGATPAARRDLLLRGGLRITTTLDLSRQQMAEQAVAAVLPDPVHEPDAAVVSIEPITGFVRALVGGRDFFGTDPQAKFDLAVQGRRQAGSAFKPFVLAAALELGIPLSKTYAAPSHIDIPLAPPADPPVWPVDNAENEASGDLDLIEATVHSVNTVFAQLVMDVTPTRAVAMANRLGIRSTLQAYPSMVLGSNDVSPLEMASAYGTLANGGLRVPPTFVTRVTRPDGTLLYSFQPDAKAVLDGRIAAAETAVLEQVVTRGTGRGADIGRPVAGKTGTAEDWHDAWFVGYTRELSTAVWVGYADQQRSMLPPTTPFPVFGGTWPASIWQRYMSAALQGVPVSSFTPPDPVSMVTTTTTTSPILPVLEPITPR